MSFVCILIMELSPASAAAAPVIQQTLNFSVRAPVSIHVTASGTDPETAGRLVYDVTEQRQKQTWQNHIFTENFHISLPAVLVYAYIPVSAVNSGKDEEESKNVW